MSRQLKATIKWIDHLLLSNAPMNCRILLTRYGFDTRFFHPTSRKQQSIQPKNEKKISRVSQRDSNSILFSAKNGISSTSRYLLTHFIRLQIWASPSHGRGEFCFIFWISFEWVYNSIAAVEERREWRMFLFIFRKRIFVQYHIFQRENFLRSVRILYFRGLPYFLHPLFDRYS